MNLFEGDQGTMILENDILKVNINMNYIDDDTLNGFLNHTFNFKILLKHNKY